MAVNQMKQENVPVHNYGGGSELIFFFVRGRQAIN